jgi:hypothetical protein
MLGAVSVRNGWRASASATNPRAGPRAALIGIKLIAIDPGEIDIHATMTIGRNRVMRSRLRITLGDRGRTRPRFVTVCVNGRPD